MKRSVERAIIDVAQEFGFVLEARPIEAEYFFTRKVGGCIDHVLSIREGSSGTLYGSAGVRWIDAERFALSTLVSHRTGSVFAVNQLCFCCQDLCRYLGEEIPWSARRTMQTSDIRASLSIALSAYDKHVAQIVNLEALSRSVECAAPPFEWCFTNCEARLAIAFFIRNALNRAAPVSEMVDTFKEHFPDDEKLSASIARITELLVKPST